MIFSMAGGTFSRIDHFQASPQNLNIFIYLFLALLGLHFFAQAFSSCGEPGLFFVVVCRLLIVVASLVLEHRLQGGWASSVVAYSLSSCGTLAQLLHSMWNLPRPGIETMFPALAGRCLSVVPPGKYSIYLSIYYTRYLFQPQ